MTPVKIEVEIIKTPKGNYRIKFQDGGSVLVKDIPDNWPLIVSLEVEYENGLNK